MKFRLEPRSKPNMFYRESERLLHPHLSKVLSRTKLSNVTMIVPDNLAQKFVQACIKKGVPYDLDYICSYRNSLSSIHAYLTIAKDNLLKIMIVDYKRLD